MGVRRKVVKLNDVVGESKSPPGMKNRNESGDPRIVHRRAKRKSCIQQYFSYVYDDIVRGE